MNKRDYCLSLHTAYASKEKKYHSLKLLAYLSSTNLEQWSLAQVCRTNLNLVALIEPNGRVVPPVST